MENTTLFDVKAMKEHLIKETLLEVTESLKERGYNASNQLVCKEGVKLVKTPLIISSKSSFNKSVKS